MAIHGTHMTSRDDMRWTFDAVTVNSAAALGLDGYGIARGNPADCVLPQAANPIEAIRQSATRLVVIKAGRIVSETSPKRAKLRLEGRPGTLDPADCAPVENG